MILVIGGDHVARNLNLVRDVLDIDAGDRDDPLFRHEVEVTAVFGRRDDGGCGNRELQLLLPESIALKLFEALGSRPRSARNA